MLRRWVPIAAAAMTLAAGAPFPATTMSRMPAGECVQTTRGSVYRTMANDRYPCEVDGHRLMIYDFGRKVAAPEGSYVNVPGGKRCEVGKGGMILSCSLR